LPNDSDSCHSVDNSAILHAVLDSAVDGIISIDESGTMESVNAAAESLFGYPAVEMLGQNVSMLMPSPYRDEHDQYLKNYQQTQTARIIGIGREVPGRRKDGTLFPLYLAVSEVKLSDRRVFTGFVHDLTELRKAEDQATELGRILEDSLNEIYVFDAQTLKFQLVNRGALANIGYSAEELKSLTPVDLRPGYDRAQLRANLAPLLSGQSKLVQTEAVHRRKDGSEYHVVVRLQRTTWLGNDAFVAIILDITEQKKIQDRIAVWNAELEERVEERTRELAAAQEQLVRREKLAVMGQLAGGVAHEIRNPLGVIRNCVYYLKTKAEHFDQEDTDCIEDIEREVLTANRIVSELLDFTRDSPSLLVTFTLEEAFENAIRTLIIPDTVNVIRQNIDGIILRADQGQIERILANLIRNACQAMDNTGTLTVSATSNGLTAQIQVHDTGPGVLQDDIQHIFEPLYTTKAKGIGLGLAVSRRYAERNDGALTVTSPAGGGTAFLLTLPVVAG